MAPESIEDQRAREPERLVAIGRVIRPHGVRGVLVVAPISPLLEGLREGSQVWLGQGELQSQVTYLHPHRQRYLLALEALSDRDQAEAWRGAEISVAMRPDTELPENSYFYWQILGLTVVTVEGEELGKIASIIETGANDVYVVKPDGGQELLLPAIAEVVRGVDLQAGVMTVYLLPGLRPDA